MISGWYDSFLKIDTSQKAEIIYQSIIETSQDGQTQKKHEIVTEEWPV